MSRKRGFRLKGEEPGIWLPRHLVRSEAWRTMSPNAKAVFLDIRDRAFNGVNNGQIVYSCRNGQGIGLSKDQTPARSNELIDRGFLQIRRDAAFRFKSKEAREWTLTSEKLDERPATKDYMKWQPKIETRSHQRDAQSHQRDNEAVIQNDYRVSVAPVRPSTQKIGLSRSHQCDTSNIPSVREKPWSKYGEIAFLERTRR